MVKWDFFFMSLRLTLKCTDEYSVIKKKLLNESKILYNKSINGEYSLTA